MSEQSKVSLYQEQKKIRPKIEDVIQDYLDNNKLKSALDFIFFLKSNKMPPQWASADSWSVSYKNKRVCYIKLGNGSWRIVHSGDYDSGYENCMFSEGLKEYIWNNVCFCRNCAGCAPGIHATILGKEFDHVCFCGKFQFTNPDAEALHCSKRLVDVRKNAILGNL